MALHFPEQAATTLVVLVQQLVVRLVTIATVPAPQHFSILAQHSLALLLFQQTMEVTTSLLTLEMEAGRTMTFCISFQCHSTNVQLSYY